MSDKIIEKIRESEKKLFVGLAGPGTGKSFTFKTIVESDEYKDKKILILSFINKLVDDLSEEFKEFGNVEVVTLHSFARQQLAKKGKNSVDLDQDLDEQISEDYFFIKGSKISYKKRFYEDFLTKEEEDFYKERKKFYGRDKNLYSFNSIIYAINRLFKNKSKIPIYDLILIDEFQDFNKSEYELIKLLNKKSKLVLVGDDDQSLYYFKEAKPEQIRSLYNHCDSENFSLDYCYRCTEVIVDATNDLIKNAQEKSLLGNRENSKKFLYPKKRRDNKNEVSEKYPQIDFLSSVSGNKLIYKLAETIKEDIGKGEKGRILVLVPHYLKQKVYEGLMKKKFNVVEFKLFSDEKCKEIKHKILIETFGILAKRKTDNLALRKILSLYLTNNKIKNLIIKSHKKQKLIWNCLDQDKRSDIESDIEIFKKVKRGKDELNKDELKRFSEVFNLKNIISKMIKGFEPSTKGSMEIEMTTVMSSKGLSAEFVYYVGIDDRNILDRETSKINDYSICEFLVGITRAKKKLTLISLQDDNPKILDFIDKKYINKIK